MTVLLVVASLAGCGRAGPPQPPDDEPRTYPREYPTR
ncbi:MAG: lipoprotein [Alphaproteobacteria bacterium]